MKCEFSRFEFCKAGVVRAGLTLTRATAQQRFGAPERTLVDDRHPEQGFKSMFNGKDLAGWDQTPSSGRCGMVRSPAKPAKRRPRAIPS